VREHDDDGDGDGADDDVVWFCRLEIVNVTQDDAGVYTCVGERAMDRTYVSSWVNLAQPLSPVMLFLPCNDLSPTSTSGVGSSSQPYQVSVSSYLNVHSQSDRRYVFIWMGWDEATPCRKGKGRGKRPHQSK